MQKDIEAIVTLHKIRYHNDNNGFSIVVANLKKLISGEAKLSRKKLILKGDFNMNNRDEYKIQAEFTPDDKWGNQYTIISCSNMSFADGVSDEQFNTFLKQILGDKQADKILENVSPKSLKKILESNDNEKIVKKLTEINGIGEYRANKIIDQYYQNLDSQEAVIKLSNLGFGKRQINTIFKHYLNNYNQVKSIADSDPYQFSLVKGITFDSVDEALISHGFDKRDHRRINAYIAYLLYQDINFGNSYEPFDKVYQTILPKFGITKDDLFRFLNDSKLFSVSTLGDTLTVSLRKQRKLEENIYKELNNRLSVKPKKQILAVGETIKSVEEKQGFKFSEDQIDAIKKLISTNIGVLSGKAGTGKTATMRAVSQLFEENGLAVYQCALSGKASNNLQNSTGREASTVHKLLRIGIDSPSDFDHDHPADVVILDEISMIDTSLFYKLLSSLREDARLIMVGDIGQLPAIGVGIIKGLLASKIPFCELTHVHRQNDGSAILNDALSIREGLVPADLSPNNNGKALGKLQDLTYIFSDTSQDAELEQNIFKKYQELISQGKNFDEVMVISSLKRVANKLNTLIQSKYNADDSGKTEKEIRKGVIIRVGDRVINLQNNYQAKDVDGNLKPVYNGNTGVVKSIVHSRENDASSNDVDILIEFDNIGEVWFTKDDCANLDLGYACTIHKAQGSTIPYVLVGIPFSYMMSSRQLLYTAITRAQKECYVFGNLNTLKQCIMDDVYVDNHTILETLMK
jgi:exodeoxyribonuclease V alpha subunit